MQPSRADIGIVIVAFQSEDVIAACLESIAASQGVRPRIVVVDNASPDATCATVRGWAASRSPGLSFAEARVGALDRADADVTLLRAPVNGGFAFAVNRGIEVLRTDPDLDLFWVLNPDCEVLPDTASHFVRAGRDGAFALMGGRTIFHGRRDRIQTDGGRVSLLTGVVTSVNSALPVDQAHMPDASEIDFVTGASCVASRRFIDRAGLMSEDYFLYYEEVDWAFRRGDLPLRQVPEAIVLHHGGTTIGTGTIDRRPSPFSNYFNARNRIRFMRRFAPSRLGLAYLHGLAKTAHLALSGAYEEAAAFARGLFSLPPPAAVRARIDPAAHELAFGKPER